MKKLIAKKLLKFLGYDITSQPGLVIKHEFPIREIKVLHKEPIMEPTEFPKLLGKTLYLFIDELTVYLRNNREKFINTRTYHIDGIAFCEMSLKIIQNGKK